MHPMFSIYRNRTALVPLTATWESADATLREAILQASRRVDEQLQNSPQEQGESREEGTRPLPGPPGRHLRDRRAEETGSHPPRLGVPLYRRWAGHLGMTDPSHGASLLSSPIRAASAICSRADWAMAVRITLTCTPRRLFSTRTRSR